MTDKAGEDSTREPFLFFGPADFYHRYNKLAEGPRWDLLSQEHKDRWVFVANFHERILRQEVARAYNHKARPKIWSMTFWLELCNRRWPKKT